MLGSITNQTDCGRCYDYVAYFNDPFAFGVDKIYNCIRIRGLNN